MSRRLLMEQFSQKFTRFFLAVGLIITFIGGAIPFYLVNNNYDLFVRAGLLTEPRIADQLLSEVKLINQVLIVSFIALIILMISAGTKLSQKFVMPVLIVQEKLREFARGNLAADGVRVRKSDEFQELAETTNFLSECLRTQLKTDLQRLSKLKPDEHNRDAVHEWETMVTEKLDQLNDPEFSVPGLESVSRRAS